ncbi:RagB/SusD family nutrient uptake outer membrane protein [Flavihumibacter petaseus]|uniref:RagB/SusD family nutrient uptake outer membrane protein n=1 Tax=Flavihumibacter petaseus NBRC 106054 TaxID=1220578 RepID=A0A0E9MUU0_9BACT|nr:RagB/SusD family nutrient uptake outer membrane protein [Flavihumibacter petaseus]GAO41517.1 hypothetical protein FPE01S_01_05310 [Flavihumibacter petaseus NBRC 106054]
MKNITSILLAGAVLLASGCSRDFLERPPLNQVSAATYWETDQAAIMGVSAVYDALQVDRGYRLGVMMFGDVAADDMACYDPGWFVDLDTYTVNSQDQQVLGSWRAWWAGIARANTAIARIPGIDMDESLKTRLVNEAKFVRALCYFNVVNIWGDAPLITTEMTTEQLSVISRSPKEELWAQIEKDLTDAQALPLNYPASSLGRATKGAAMGLLSRAYLYQGKFEAARDMAKAVIDLNVYDLHELYIRNFQTAFENGIESIFEVQFVPGTGGWGNNEGNWTSNYTGPNAYVPTGGWSIIVPEPGDTKIYEAGDLRRAVNIFEAGSVYSGIPYDPAWSPQKETHLAKYIVGDDIISTQGMIDADRNMPVIRYAEILLTYAECLNETGQTAAAEPYINKVRERAGLDPVHGLSKDVFRDAVIQERRVEFFGEGHRFFDIRRIGKSDYYIRQVLGKENFDVNKNLYFPIPVTEIELNPNLVQNPNY